MEVTVVTCNECIPVFVCLTCNDVVDYWSKHYTYEGAVYIVNHPHYVYIIYVCEDRSTGRRHVIYNNDLPVLSAFIEEIWTSTDVSYAGLLNKIHWFMKDYYVYYTAKK